MSDNRYCTKCGGRLRRKVFRDEIGRIAHGDKYYCENCRAQAMHCSSCLAKDKEIMLLEIACADKDAEIERLREWISRVVHDDSLPLKDEARAIGQRILRGEG